MSFYDLSLNNRQNDAALVRVLKTWLNASGAADARAPLNAETAFDRATDAALRTYQRQQTLNANGVCGIRTWQALATGISRQARAELVNLQMPPWLTRLLNGRNRVAGGRITVDRDLFMTMYRTDARHLGTTDAAIGALGELLDSFAADSEITDIRWMAYMLATIRHECGGWLPVEEIGGANRDYGQLQTVECPPRSGHTTQNRYYGRGYVQVTHLGNYQQVDDHFALNCRLVNDPTLLITDHRLSYNVVSWGMRDGIFRREAHRDRRTHRLIVGAPYTLVQFIHDDVTDYFNARQIINGDRNVVHGRNTQSNGHIIEGYALIFEPIIRACLTNAV